MKNPEGAEDEWWELYDEIRNLPYYYNTGTGQTEWRRPLEGIIIPLRTLQNTSVGQNMSTAVKRMSTMSATMLSNYSSEDDSDTTKESSTRNVPTPNASPLHQQASFSSITNQSVRSNNNAMSNNSGNNRKYEQLGMVSGGSSVAAKSVEAGVGRWSPAASPGTMSPSIQISRDSSNDGKLPPTSPLSPSGSRIQNRLPRRHIETVYNPNLASLPKVKPDILMPDDLTSHMTKFRIDGFAKEHFTEQTRGLIFRHKLTVEEVLTYQRDPLRTPLMESLPKNHHKDALKSFRLVQKIMSDTCAGPPYLGTVREVQALLAIGVTSKFMRDEIYVQVCKQVRSNPYAESTFRGWLLLCVIAITFPPSREFEEYMKTFTLEHYEGVPISSWSPAAPVPYWGQDSKSPENAAIAVLAKFCNKKLIRICRVGARGKTPMIQEIERQQEAPFRASLFGETLEEIMAVQALENPKDSAGRKLALPRILLFLTDAILSLNGCQTEGIFRVPGDIDLVNGKELKLCVLFTLSVILTVYRRPSNSP
ncbi:hypothetical protein HDU98_000804 [Podochytrium sp. JEL0797]|nr:hypothetical protein HDU98_000804 [Podochytrium sp. JEL0797]